MKLVVLASGRGSNFAAIVDAIARGEIPGASVEALISNRANAPALALAKKRDIPTQLVSSSHYRRDGRTDRDRYEQALHDAIVPYAPDYLCLAGYTLLLGQTLLSAWPNRILNIHPSLLPAFKGLHAQRQALDYGVQWTGCTVHWVSAELDEGPILIQEAMPILPEDTEATLTERLLPMEHRCYIRALQHLNSERPHYQGRRIRWEKKFE